MLKPPRAVIFIVALIGVIAGGISPVVDAGPRQTVQSSSVAALDHVVGPRKNGQPFTVASLNRYIVWELATAAHVPMGIEVLPAASSSAPQQIDVAGRTLRDVLDALIAADSRYEWREMDGVVVIRPGSSWTDSENALAAPVKNVRLRNVALGRAVTSAALFLGAPRKRTVSFADTKRISVIVARGTVLDMLNAIAREHGELAWAFATVEARDAERTGYRHELSFYVMGGTGSGILVR